MDIKKQQECIRSFLAALGEDTQPLYLDIITCLTDLGYYPAKVRANLSFKHGLHNKQIAKIGFLKNLPNVPFLALRFSACRSYSEKIAAITAAYMEKYPKRIALCMDGGCSFCKGEPETHVYYMQSGDTDRAHCGAYAIELRGVSADDADEIKRLIQEEHAYLLEHEAIFTSIGGVRK